VNGKEQGFRWRKNRSTHTTEKRNGKRAKGSHNNPKTDAITFGRQVTRQRKQWWVTGGGVQEMGEEGLGNAMDIVEQYGPREGDTDLGGLTVGKRNRKFRCKPAGQWHCLKMKRKGGQTSVHSSWSGGGPVRGLSCGLNIICQ